MLILSRKLDESIIIGDEVEVMVVGVEGDQVKLGIDAPQKIPIHRKEVYDEIQERNRQAAQSTGDETRSASDLLRGSSEESTDQLTNG